VPQRPLPCGLHGTSQHASTVTGDGLSIDGDWPDPRRVVVGRVNLVTEHEPLRWLNRPSRWQVI
jgi:hypothetical protein